MRVYGEPQFLDITPDSPTTGVPGATPTLVEFLVQAPKSGVGDNWPIGMNYVIGAAIGIDQPASGATVIEWEDWVLGAFDSFNVFNPLLGTTHVRDTYSAAIAKHIVEFFSSGYAYADGARAQIPTTDADSTFMVYVVLPMAHELNDKPHHFGFWLGWLNATKVQCYVAPSTALAFRSTGAVLESFSIRAWIEYVVSDELIMPVVNQWNKYTTPAGGQTTHYLKGIGTQQGLNDVKDGSRVAAMLELCSAGNDTGSSMGGASSAANFTSYSLPQLSQDVTVNVDAYFSAFRRLTGGAGTASVGPLATPVLRADAYRAPYANGAVANNIGTGEQANLGYSRYIPVRAPGRNFQITKQPKFFGDLKRQATFSATPSSGQFVWVLNELRELGDAKKREMIAKTGRPGRLERIWNNGHAPDNRTSMKVKKEAGRESVLPEIVRFA